MKEMVNESNQMNGELCLIAAHVMRVYFYMPRVSP